jgi:type III pantothenate kinase
MKLLLDIGNSSVKWVWSTPQGLGEKGRFVHHGADFASLAGQAWSRLAQPRTIVVSNVAGADVAARLQDWTQQHWQQVPGFLAASRAAAGVRNGYAEPETLGIDRWAALVAAYTAWRSSVCVVDCGTAITLDLLDTDGTHRGGLILAGIGLMQSALQGNTANLDVPVANRPLQLLASTTGDAIASGSVYAAAAAIEHIAGRMATQCNQLPRLLLTGGDASRVMPLLGVACNHEPDLVLMGLDILSGDS